MKESDKLEVNAVERGLLAGEKMGYEGRDLAAYVSGSVVRVYQAELKAEIEELKAQVRDLKEEKAGIREKNIERVSELPRLIGKAQREGREELAALKGAENVD